MLEVKLVANQLWYWHTSFYYCMIPYKFKGCQWCQYLAYGTAVTLEQLPPAQLLRQSSNDNSN